MLFSDFCAQHLSFPEKIGTIHSDNPPADAACPPFHAGQPLIGAGKSLIRPGQPFFDRVRPPTRKSLSHLSIIATRALNSVIRQSKRIHTKPPAHRESASASRIEWYIAIKFYHPPDDYHILGDYDWEVFALWL